MRTYRVLPHEGDSHVMEKLLATFTTDRIVMATHVCMHNKMKLAKEEGKLIWSKLFCYLCIIHDCESSSIVYNTAIIFALSSPCTPKSFTPPCCIVNRPVQHTQCSRWVHEFLQTLSSWNLSQNLLVGPKLLLPLLHLSDSLFDIISFHTATIYLFATNMSFYHPGWWLCLCSSSLVWSHWCCCGTGESRSQVGPTE